MSEDGKELFMQREEVGEDDPRLELGLSLCMGIRFGKRAERARILTAQDLPSCANGSPTSASQVVGWPPIQAYRMNSLVNISKAPIADDVNSAIADTKSSKNGPDEKVYEGTETNANAEESRRVRLVKVYMDGVPIGRKVDLNAHSHYETLARTLSDMFLQHAGRKNLRGVGAKGPLNWSSASLLDNLSEFVLTYEDKEGDWMLVGDVPWGMFLTAVRRLKIMRTSEAKGLIQDVKKGMRKEEGNRFSIACIIPTPTHAKDPYISRNLGKVQSSKRRMFFVPRTSFSPPLFLFVHPHLWEPDCGLVHISCLWVVG